MNIAIVGATGVVGQEMLSALKRRNFPVDELHLVASERSAGKEVETPFGTATLQVLSKEVFKGVDIALFAAGSSISEEWGPIAVEAGALVIDNSSFFRYQDDVPLVIPEINAKAAKEHKGIIANPNCTTAIAALPLWAIHQQAGIKKVIVSTYQAASGAGKAGMDELEEQTFSYANKEEMQVDAFAHQLFQNVIPHIDAFQENGYTKEEMKVAWETRKIFGLPDLPVSCTAVRIPIKRAHSEAITVETEQPVEIAALRTTLEEMTGVDLVDDVENNTYPMPLDASEKDNVLVGRLRQSIVFDNGVDFFVSGDQLLKGAALNAVQIAELFIK